MAIVDAFKLASCCMANGLYMGAWLTTLQVEVHDPALAERIWQRVKDFIEPTVDIAESDTRCEAGMDGRWEAFGINPYLLFARYGPGGHFSPHTDGYTIVDFNTRSLYSFLLYLNDCKEGGSTRLLSKRKDGQGADTFEVDAAGRFRWDESRVLDLAPCKTGTALVFSQDLPHEGEPVGEGCAKYLIRTDVMYRRVPPLLDTPNDKKAFELYREAELLEADGHPAEAAKMFRRCMKLSPGLAEVYGL